MTIKPIVFILAAVTLIVSIIGLLISFGAAPAFISIFPQDLRIYFGITAVMGLALIFICTNRRMY